MKIFLIWLLVFSIQLLFSKQSISSEKLLIFAGSASKPATEEVIQSFQKNLELL